MIDRLSPRTPPARCPAMHQTWGKLLFLHWPVAEEAIRPLIPAGLAIDTWDGAAWVGITPFTMWNLRPPYIPPLPLLSRSHEINVRTYVHRDGQPGIWFFSLDANNTLAVLGARLFFGLPYYEARMDLDVHGSSVGFCSTRRAAAGPAASFRAGWTGGNPLPELRPGTLDFFLIERYILYTRRRDDLYRSRIHHTPWPLREAVVTRLDSTMLSASGIPEPTTRPLVHFQAKPLHVKVWRPEKV